MTPECSGGRIPLTVIGGFLGAGKTTLLNRLLAQAGGRRLAVLVNDFGAINIDAALVASSGADAVSLVNGCVCCQIGGDLTDALIRVIEAQPPPDAIVVEASGVSDPWRIAQVALADPALALDGVLVLVDAVAVREQANDPLLADTIRRQLAAADLLVVNHCDRIDTAGLATLRAWLEEVVPSTPRHETRWAEVPDALLGAPAARLAHVHDSGCSRLHDPQHGESFETCSIVDDSVYAAGALRALLRNMPAGVLRLKGIVRTDRHGWTVLQFAGRRGSLRAWPAKTLRPADGTQNSLVAIGVQGRLPVYALQQAFAAAAASPNLRAGPSNLNAAMSGNSAS